jgi:hypothetical protein
MGRLDPEQRGALTGRPDELSGDALDKLLQEEYKVSTFQCLVAKAQALDLSPYNVAHYRVTPQTFERIPQDFCQENLALPVGQVGEMLLVAFANPFEVVLPTKIQEMTGKPVVRMLAREKDIRDKLHDKAAGFDDVVMQIGAEYGEDAAKGDLKEEDVNIPAVPKVDRPLNMRSNRLLGANLVEHNLVTIENLELACEKHIEAVSSEQARQSTILGILAYDMKVLKEDDVLHHIVETEGVGLVDLRDYDVPEEFKKNLDLRACWATWSVPFDHKEGFTFMATAYFLSPAVRTYWEKQVEGPILWFGTTLEGIADYLEKFAALPSTGGLAAPGPGSNPAPQPAK